MFGKVLNAPLAKYVTNVTNAIMDSHQISLMTLSDFERNN